MKEALECIENEGLIELVQHTKLAVPTVPAWNQVTNLWNSMKISRLQ